MLREPEQTDGYTVEAFVRSAGELARVSTDEESGRWTRLATLLPSYDVQVSDRPTEGHHRSAVLEHLMIQACGPGPIGYWTEHAHVRLDTSERCGVLAGQPRIVAVGGHSIIEAPGEAFATVDEACARGRGIRVETAEGKRLKVACAEPIVLPTTMTLTAIPTIAAP